MKAILAVAVVAALASTTAIDCLSAQENSRQAPSAESALTAMKSADLSIAQVQSLTSIGSVQIISVESLEPGEESVALQHEITNQRGSVEELRRAILSNEKLMSMIRSKMPDLPINKVVAFELQPPNHIVIYTLG